MGMGGSSLREVLLDVRTTSLYIPKAKLKGWGCERKGVEN